MFFHQLLGVILTHDEPFNRRVLPLEPDHDLVGGCRWILQPYCEIEDSPSLSWCELPKLVAEDGLGNILFIARVRSSLRSQDLAQGQTYKYRPEQSAYFHRKQYSDRLEKSATHVPDKRFTIPIQDS